MTAVSQPLSRPRSLSPADVLVLSRLRPEAKAETRSATDRLTLVAVLTVAFLLRAGLAIAYPGISHADEIFQYQEPAHKLLTGFGITPWEWVLHMRSWLIPGLVLPIMAVVRVFTDNPSIFAAVLSCVMAAASLPVVGVAYSWGREQTGRDGGIIAAAMVALSFQMVYFSAHLLADTVAADLLIPALYLCRAYRRSLTSQTRHLAAAAALLALLVYLRPQLTPALMLPTAALLLASRRRNQAKICLAAGLGAFTALGLFDWLTLGRPFQSMWLYTYVNLFQTHNEFGSEPLAWYLTNTASLWSAAIIPAAYFCWRGARNFRLEAATALLIVLTLSLIGHKEARFILPAIALLLILTGIGIAAVRTDPARHTALPNSITLPARVLPLLYNALKIALLRAHTTLVRARTAEVVAGIALLSLLLGTRHHFLAQIERGHQETVMAERISHDPQACGIYYLPRGMMLSYGGYSGARDHLRLTSERYDTPAQNVLHANYILTRGTDAGSTPIPAGYSLVACKHDAAGQVCEYHRPGGCDQGQPAFTGVNAFGNAPTTLAQNE